MKRRFEEEVYERARKRVKKKRAFLREVFVFGGVVTLCLFINIMSGGRPWFQWVAFPWGIILLFRGISLWSNLDRWEEREMEKEIDRYNNSMLRSVDDDLLDLEDMDGPLEEPLPRHKRSWQDRDLI